MTDKIIKDAERLIKRHSVAVNHCRCHPETCCCDDWKVVDGEGNKVATYYSMEDAEALAARLNRAEPDPRDEAIRLRDEANQILADALRVAREALEAMLHEGVTMFMELSDDKYDTSPARAARDALTRINALLGGEHE